MSSESRSEPTTSAAAGERSERQYIPQSGSRNQLALALGMIGYAALGAGVYGAWLASSAVALAWPLLIGGLVLAIGAAFVSPKEAPPVRVGDLGVIVGDPAEARRLHWHELSGVRIVDDELRLESGVLSGGVLALPLAAHARAAARIVAEASQRLPARVDISPKAHERLPRLAEAEGEQVQAARLQLAGQRCAASGASITFESDARWCQNCAALYHAKHVPPACLRCERPLGAGEGAQVRAASSDVTTG